MSFFLSIGTPCSIGHTISSRFGGSSSTINDQHTNGTSSPMLSTRPDFSSETDIRKSRTPVINPSIPSNIGRNNIQHSNSTSALRTSDYHPQVTYFPQSSIPTINPLRSQSVHPSSSTPYIPDNSSLVNRPTTSVNNIYASTASLSSTTSGGTTTQGTQISGKGFSTTNIPLTKKSITTYSNRMFRVIFSDDSAMIIQEDSPDGQIFIDPQGKRYTFDRRQPHQPEVIQERLALFYQNEHDLVDYTTSQ